MQSRRATMFVAVTAVVTVLILATTVFAVLHKPVYKAQSGQGRFYLEFLKEHSSPEWHTMWQQLWDLNEDVVVPRSALRSITDDVIAASTILEHIASYAFWVDDTVSNGSYEFSANNDVITIKGIKYFDNAVAMRASLEIALLSTYHKIYEGSSQKQTIANLNAYLYNNVSYGDGGSMDGQTVYSVLVDREAVCGGFARTFNILALMSDIDSHIVAGYLLTSKGAVRHAWNSYTIDGIEYVTDSTANKTSKRINRVVNVEKAKAYTLQSYVDPEIHAFGVVLR